MQFNSSCKAIETWIEGFFIYLVNEGMATKIRDGYNSELDNSVYSRIYKVHTIPDQTRAVFRYDQRINKDTPSGAGYFEISNDGLQLIFQQLSFYTILKAIGISIFNENGEFDNSSLKSISDKVFEATGKRIEIRLIE